MHKIRCVRLNVFRKKGIQNGHKNAFHVVMRGNGKLNIFRLFILHVSVHEKTILRDYSVYSYSGIRLIERDLSQEKKCAERDTVPPK